MNPGTSRLKWNQLNRDVANPAGEVLDHPHEVPILTADPPDVKAGIPNLDDDVQSLDGDVPKLNAEA